MKTLTGAAIVFAILLGAPHSAQTQTLTSSARGENADATGIGHLVGAWAATVDLQAQGPGFQSLLTFTSDGIALADEPGAFETTGHGAWTPKGRRTATFSFRAFLGSASGAMTGQVRVTGTVRLQ